MSDSYLEHQAQVKAEQSSLTRDEVVQLLKDKRDEFNPDKPLYEGIFDPDNLTPTQHRWIDRGTVMSCEGGTHPSHRAFKRR